MHHATHICVATLGGQPQVVTLALDALLARGVPIREVVVVHLSDQNPRYRAARACVAREFAGERYAGREMRFRQVPVLLGGSEVDDLHDDQFADAALDTFQRLFQRLKDQSAVIHLCPSGGRRLLGLLALSAAQIWFDQTDRLWHLYSSDELRERTCGGAVMHLGPHPDARLVRVPLQPLGSLVPGLRLGHTGAADQYGRLRDAEQWARCEQVWQALTGRQREVLCALVKGLSPQAVAERLHISVPTVDAHKTPIFQECRNAWGLPPEQQLTYHWLRGAFRDYLRV
jgi:CRISPR-associated protein Csx14